MNYMNRLVGIVNDVSSRQQQHYHEWNRLVNLLRVADENDDNSEYADELATRADEEMERSRFYQRLLDFLNEIRRYLTQEVDTLPGEDDLSIISDERPYFGEDEDTEATDFVDDVVNRTTALLFELNDV